jgi:hypothetical protein
MADEDMREVIARVVDQVLNEHMAALRGAIVERACAELQDLEPAPPVPPPGAGPTDLLSAAFASVLDSSSQADILSALLAGAAKFSARAALFVIRGTSAVGWRATGFGDDHAIRTENLHTGAGLIARAIHDRLPVAAAAAEFDSGFVARLGAPAEGTNVLVLPLVLHEKVPAIVYADGGDGGPLDASALECLVRATGLWLEVVSLRKGHAAEGPGTISQKVQVAEAAEPAPPVHAEPEPSPAAIEPEPEPVPVAAAAEAEAPAPSEPAPPPEAHPMAEPAPVVPAAPAAEEDEVHRKARRFAKLLVEEIKLYNQAKVAQGRTQKKVYFLLRDDIEKSRSSYNARYGQTSAAAGDYFTEQVVKVLCDGDASLLGEPIPR